MAKILGPIRRRDPSKNTERTAPQIRSVNQTDSRIYQEIFPLTYTTIRSLRRDPTVQLARWAVLAPMIHTPWTYVSPNNLATKEMLKDVEDNLSPYRDLLLQQAVFGICDFGWQPFEVVYRPEEGRILFDNFKALLQDFTTILVYVDTGQFAGFTNEIAAISENSAETLSEEYSLCTNFSVEGTDWYGYSVFESLYRIQNSWDAVETTANRYDRKIAGATHAVYFPVGKTLYNGIRTSNDIIAKELLSSLEASGGVAIPDEIQNWIEDENDTIDENTKGKWRIELIESKGNNQGSFIERQKYLDALKMRAFGLTERSVLEGSHGTKAEAATHADVSISIIHAKHILLCNQITTGPIRRFMEVNYGKKYAYAVKLQPAPLVDAQFGLVRDIYRLIMQTPDTLVEEVQKLDLESMRTQLNIPSTDTPQLKIKLEKKPPSEKLPPPSNNPTQEGE